MLCQMRYSQLHVSGAILQMDDILTAEIDNAMLEALEWLEHIDCMIFQDDKPSNDARIILLRNALDGLRGGGVMKIVETTERECCAVQDMKPYKGGFTGAGGMPLNPQFCVHCGQIHIDRTGDSGTIRVSAIISIMETYNAKD